MKQTRAETTDQIQNLAKINTCLVLGTGSSRPFAKMGMIAGSTLSPSFRTSSPRDRPATCKSIQHQRFRARMTESNRKYNEVSETLKKWNWKIFNFDYDTSEIPYRNILPVDVQMRWRQESQLKSSLKLA